jgi:hypothetical protein
MRLYCRNVRRTQTLDFVPCQRLARLRCKFLLLSFERHRRWRRRRLCHHGAVGNLCRRLGDMLARWGRSSENTVSGWSHLSPPTDRSRRNLPRVHGDYGSAHRLGARKRALRNSGHPAGCSPIGVPDFRIVSVIAIIVASVVVRDLIVVDVCDRCVVDDRVADVDAVYIFTAGVIPGHIDFSWAQREPSHIAATASANRNRQAETRSANKGYERGSIHGPHSHRAGHPAPVVP